MHTASRLPSSILGILLTLAFTLALPVRVTAQSSGSKTTAVDVAAVEWQALHAKLLQARSTEADSAKDVATGGAAGTDGATRQPNKSEPQADAKIRRQAAVDRYRQLAEQIREFEEKYPGHPMTTQAKRQEALTLLHAAFLGDETDNHRRDQLVAELRADASLTQAERCEVAAYAENLAVTRARLPHWQKLDAHEKVARRMIAEFPQVPTSYESLLSVAKARSDDSAVKVARELLALADAPKHVKADAEAVLVRVGLRGLRLAEILSTEPKASALLTQRGSQRVVLYTWATWSPGSIAMAKRLAAEIPSNVILIGLNLDTGSATAQARAQEEGLAGDHLYDPQGRAGAVAKMLGCNSTGLILVTDQSGRVTSISAQRGWNATSTNLRRE